MRRHVLFVVLFATFVAAGEARAQVTTAFLRADIASPQQTQTVINFYGSAVGGTQPHEYKWWLWDGTAWRVLRDWHFSSALGWIFESPGQYIVAIWVRSHGSSVNAPEALAQMRYDITPFVTGVVPKIQIFFTRNSPPYYPGESVILEAWISGSYEPELKWVLWDGQRWSVLREWQREEVFVWTPPSTPGVYRVAVWVRHGDVSVDAPQAAREMLIEVLPNGGVPQAGSIGLTQYLPSPQAVGTSIVFSAYSIGGRAPYDYKWWQWDGVTWSVLADWSTSASVTWSPARSGQYLIIGWTRSQGTVSVFQPAVEVPYTIDPAGTPPPARTANLAVQKPDPSLSGLRFSSKRRQAEESHRTSSSGG